MRVVIVEDEFVAARNLERMIQTVDESAEILVVLQSVEESVEWFSTNASPDVVFMDIHLADGDVFSVFDKVEILSPVIFTTAYDEYALKAFEVNSIDYLLKPISRQNLEKALKKLTLLTSNKQNNTELVSQIVQSMREEKRLYKRHFLIPYKDKLIPLSVDEIAYIYTEYKITRIVCFNRKTFTLDNSLDELMSWLNPVQFFRANRQYIVSHCAIVDLSVWFGGKLAVNLLVETPERIIVSRARNRDFKNWYMDNAT
ncbi:LytR/AlgR family response regulator transcription factor [Proteiniphilum sp. UBA1028]|jgi:two-component system LytT family response regulator|uniref:LytR/AlgR family response regulator transcription factor n=1 Tax=Proteiniphilum sp. UBA1028 TaxID=1947251 RepID=UPI000E909785|nr:LytTR family DNA-binding domain-containing protein [Proteiniphilum sp. UBA1028]HBG57675.1 DNA-binding response regulator [Porphyromonadaceae bacterium]